MLLRQQRRAPRIRILVRTTEHHEHRHGAGHGLLDLLLRVPGVVGADLIVVAGQRGVVAGIAEQHRQRFARLLRDAQNRHIRSLAPSD